MKEQIVKIKTNPDGYLPLAPDIDILTNILKMHCSNLDIFNFKETRIIIENSPDLFIIKIQQKGKIKYEE